MQMFRPEANRLCKFLEVSALSIALATRGGFQGKQGYLRVMSSNASRRAKSGFHPIDWKERREPKWFIVRESYLVSVDEPDQSAIFDVFLVDDEFQIERPTRLIKQGIHLFDKLAESLGDGGEGEEAETDGEGGKKDKKMKHKGGAKGEAQLRGQDEFADGVGDPDDPSTTDLAAADPRHLRNASSHTFYIINAERRVKVVAKNERQMDQFIASCVLFDAAICVKLTRFRIQDREDGRPLHLGGQEPIRQLCSDPDERSCPMADRRTGLLLESQSGDLARQGAHLHPRLVARELATSQDSILKLTIYSLPSCISVDHLRSTRSGDWIVSSNARPTKECRSSSSSTKRSRTASRPLIPNTPRSVCSRCPQTSTFSGRLPIRGLATSCGRTTRRCASSTRRLPLWEVSISASDGGTLLGTS